MSNAAMREYFREDCDPLVEETRGFRWAARAYLKEPDKQTLADLEEAITWASNTGTYSAFDAGVEAFIGMTLDIILFAEATEEESDDG